MERADKDRLINLVQGEPWAIMPERAPALVRLIGAAISGAAPSETDIASLSGKRAQRDREIRQTAGVLVLPLTGLITPRAGIFDFFGLATGLDRWTARFEQAVRNSDIQAIVIDIDSPGGSVYGVEEAAAIVYAARGEKKVIAVANPLAASAAYWIASAAGEITVTPSGEAGSIGVIAIHAEYSRALEEMGIGVTVFSAGKHKADGNPFEALSEEAAQGIQRAVDDYYDDFVAAVARHREVEPDEVRNGLGEGRVLTADRAVEERLADRVGSLDTVLTELGVDRGSVIDVRARGRAKLTRDVAAAIPESWSGPQISVALPPRERDDSNVFLGIAADGTEENNRDGVGGAASPDDQEGAPRDQTAPEAKEDTVGEKNTAAQDGAAGTTQDPGISVGIDGTQGERKRAKDISELCAMHGCSEKAAEWIDQGWSVGRVAQEILKLERQKAPELGVPEPQARVDLTNREGERYSIVRLIRAAAGMESMESAGLELEVHEDLSKQLKDRKGRGFLVPTLGLPRPRGADMAEVARLARAFGMKTWPAFPSGPGAVLETGTATAGQELVFTEPGTFIEMLRNRLVTAQLGATFLPGLQGNVSFPKQTGAGTFSWRAEAPGSDVALSDLATDQVTLTPKDGTSATSFSRRLLAQSVINVEQLVRSDLARIAAIGIDFAALHGAGAPSPTGIYSTTGVASVAFGGAVNWADIVQLETEVAADNADIGVMAYATTPEVRGNAKTAEKATGTAQFIWTGGGDNGEMNGFRAVASNQFLKNMGAGTNEHGIIFGVWDQLLIGEWGALELIVDPYTLARQGLIGVTLFVIADVAVRYPEAFSIGTGLIPA